MALGDGIRRNIRTVTPEERERFRSALLAVQVRHSQSVVAERPADRAFDWFGQDEIRQAARRHHGLEFLPWHRELCNRFEQVLRDADPELSLHYWDWNEDPHELFTPTFMSPGSADAPFEGLIYGPAWLPLDSEIVGADSFHSMRALLESKHDAAHFVYFGGTFVNAHISLHDPGAFLLHSNADRLFAMWQAEEGQAWRLDPSQVYGAEGGALGTRLIDPWAGSPSFRPWVPAQSLPSSKTYVDPSVVAPPCYDTLAVRVEVDEAATPGRVITFDDVYVGKTFARAASFRIFGGGNLTFEVTSGPCAPYAVITPGGVVTAPHSPILYQEARIWFGFTGGVPSSHAPAGTVIIRCRETGQDFAFTLQANTIPLPRAGVVLSLDEGGGNTADPEKCSRWAGVTWTWTWKPVCDPNAKNAEIRPSQSGARSSELLTHFFN